MFLFRFGLVWGDAMVQPVNVFVSYRRMDSTPHLADRIGEALKQAFENVFVDVDFITPGSMFGDAIGRALSECEILLVLIGRDWINVVDDQGRRRLDDPDDWIVRELRTALDRDIRVIPVLTDGVRMPRRDELPPALKQLADRHYLTMHRESFDHDMDRLLTAIHDSRTSGHQHSPITVSVELKANSWLRDRFDSIPGSGHGVLITVETRSRQAVILRWLEPVVVSRLPVSSDNWIVALSALPVRFFDVWLDEDPPLLSGADGHDFPFTVSERDPEMFLVKTHFTGGIVSWYLNIAWHCQGRNGVHRIDMDGQPFRTAGPTRRTDG